MYTTLRTEQKMTSDQNASKKEEYYNSESEGKEYKDFDEKYDAYIQATGEETYGEEFWQDGSKEKEDN